MANNNNGGDLKISHLFIAGAVTAAGAAFFWWVKNMATQERKEEADADDDLAELMLVAEADNVEAF